MSNNIPMPWLQMRTMAGAVAHYLEPYCHRVEVAGSLRRMKPMVRDIELVAIPKMDIDLFGNPLETSAIDYAFDGKPVTFIKKGQKYWQFKIVGSTGYEYTVDLFLQPDPATFGVNMLLRTGSSDFSHRMVTPKSSGGYKPNGLEVRDARVWRNGVALETPEEKDVFVLWGMEYIEPKSRN